jgi:hypothetical protein
VIRADAVIMRFLGRILQQIGLVVPLAAILLQLDGMSLGRMLIMAVFGICLFYLGRLIEGYAPR